MYGLSKTRLPKVSLALSRKENLYTDQQRTERDRQRHINAERERASMKERETEEEEKMYEYYS